MTGELRITMKVHSKPNYVSYIQAIVTNAVFVGEYKSMLVGQNWFGGLDHNSLHTVQVKYLCPHLED